MSDKHSENRTSLQDIASSIWDMARGTVDSLRLSAAERITVLLATIAIAALAVIAGSAVILFASIGAAQLLKSITPQGAYFIVAGFYLLLLIVIVACRRPLIIDPVARLVTRLLVSPPEEFTHRQSQSNDKDAE